MNEEANRVINAFGGTAEVARLCEINPQAVSHWRRLGLPPARRLFLKALRPDLFDAYQPQPVTERESAA